MSYVSACCILFYCVLFGCTVRMCDCCEAVVSNFMVAIVFMAQSLSSGVVAILDCVMAIFYRREQLEECLLRLKATLHRVFYITTL